MILSYCRGVKQKPSANAEGEKIAVPPQFTDRSLRPPHGAQTCPCAVTGTPVAAYHRKTGFRALLTKVFHRNALSAFTGRGLSEKRLPATSFDHRVFNIGCIIAYLSWFVNSSFLRASARRSISAAFCRAASVTLSPAVRRVSSRMRPSRSRGSTRV